MLVSISEATRMAGVKSRSTFYRHIKKKGISITKDAEGNPKIDTAELLRVYGDKLKTMPPKKENKERGGGDTKDAVQSNTVVQNNTPPGTSPNIQMEIGVLQEKLKNLEESKTSQIKERQKERELLSDQVETLKKALNESQDQQKRLTLLITDQREDKKDKVDLQEKRIGNLENMIETLKAQNDRFLKIEEERKKEQKNGESKGKKRNGKRTPLYSSEFSGQGARRENLSSSIKILVFFFLVITPGLHTRFKILIL